MNITRLINLGYKFRCVSFAASYLRRNACPRLIYTNVFVNAFLNHHFCTHHSQKRVQLLESASYLELIRFECVPPGN